MKYRVGEWRGRDGTFARIMLTLSPSRQKKQSIETTFCLAFSITQIINTACGSRFKGGLRLHSFFKLHLVGCSEGCGRKLQRSEVELRRTMGRRQGLLGSIVLLLLTFSGDLFIAQGMSTCQRRIYNRSDSFRQRLFVPVHPLYTFSVSPKTFLIFSALFYL